MSKKVMVMLKHLSWMCLKTVFVTVVTEYVVRVYIWYYCINFKLFFTHTVQSVKFVTHNVIFVIHDFEVENNFFTKYSQLSKYL